MSGVVSLSGPVELVEGELVLLIPLDAGGRELASVARGVGEISGEFLRVTIPEWLAAKLKIQEGTTVSVNNLDGKFNIFPEADDLS